MHSIALISNLAGPEGLLIFLIVLLLFGAKKLPELARGLGQAVKEFSKAKEDVNTEISRATQLPDYSHQHSHPQYHYDPANTTPPTTEPETKADQASPSSQASAAAPAVQSPTSTPTATPETPKSV